MNFNICRYINKRKDGLVVTKIESKPFGLDPNLGNNRLETIYGGLCGGLGAREKLKWRLCGGLGRKIQMEGMQKLVR